MCVRIPPQSQIKCRGGEIGKHNRIKPCPLRVRVTFPILKIKKMNEKELEKFGAFLSSLSEEEIDSLIELMEFNE